MEPKLQNAIIQNREYPRPSKSSNSGINLSFTPPSNLTKPSSNNHRCDITSDCPSSPVGCRRSSSLWRFFHQHNGHFWGYLRLLESWFSYPVIPSSSSAVPVPHHCAQRKDPNEHQECYEHRTSLVLRLGVLVLVRGNKSWVAVEIHVDIYGGSGQWFCVIRWSCKDSLKPGWKSMTSVLRRKSGWQVTRMKSISQVL